MQAIFRSRRELLTLAAIGAVVTMCGLLVDRPLALWANARFYQTTTFAISAFILRPLDSLLVAGLLLLAVGMVWRRQYNAPTWVNRFVVGAVAGALALLVALALKVAIGRSQVYPPFLRDHIYRFRPFAGAKDFMAFPSATMAGVTAFITGLGVHRRSDRAAATVVVCMFAAALVITNGHWLSDIIGGTYLGVVIGVAVARHLHRRTGLQPHRRLQLTTNALSWRRHETQNGGNSPCSVR